MEKGTGMNATTLNPGEIDSHLRLMRIMTVAALVSIAVAIGVVVFVSPRAGVASPLAVTLACAGAALWIGFTANRDAQVRLDRVKRAFAADGDLQHLLRGHRMVHLTVLARLEVMVVAAVVAGVWGRGSAAVWGILALAAMMMVLTWPTADKTDMLIQRAREQRGR